MKVAPFCWKKNAISILLVDELYLKNSVQYHSDYFLGQDKEGNPYKGIVVFVIVSLKQSISYIVK